MYNLKGNVEKFRQEIINIENKATNKFGIFETGYYSESTVYSVFDKKGNNLEFNETATYIIILMFLDVN